VQLIEFLNDKQTPEKKASRSVNSVLLRMKETLDGMNLKPEKGRRKDLRKIEDAVRSLRKIAVADKKND
jgi:hypothetical protein